MTLSSARFTSSGLSVLLSSFSIPLSEEERGRGEKEGEKEGGREGKSGRQGKRAGVREGKIGEGEGREEEIWKMVCEMH